MNEQLPDNSAELDELSDAELLNRLYSLLQPGLVLRKIFLRQHGLDAASLAARLHVEKEAVESLLQGRSGMTAEMALRLARLFRTEPDFWMNLQINYEFWLLGSAKRDDLEAIEPISTDAAQQGKFRRDHEEG